MPVVKTPFVEEEKKKVKPKKPVYSASNRLEDNAEDEVEIIHWFLLGSLDVIARADHGLSQVVISVGYDIQ